MKGAIRYRWLVWIMTAGLLSGCEFVVGPAPGEFDPARTAEQVSDVVEPLLNGENAFRAVDAAALALVQFSGGSADAVVSLRPDRFRLAGAGLSPGLLTEIPTPPISRVELPFTILGQTLVWDPDEDRYVVDPSRNDAPATGVRVVYYAMRPLSGVPVEPVSELGFIDLTDEDTAGEERLGIRVVDTSGDADIDLLDYYVGFDGDAEVEQGAATITAVGSLSDGTETVAFDLLQDVRWDENADREELEVVYRFDGDDASIVVAMDAEGGFGAPAFDVVSMTADILDGTDRVELDVDVAADRSVLGEILLNGAPVMEIGGIDGAPTFTRLDGTELTQAETQALLTVWRGVARALQVASWLVAPVTFLLLPG